MTCQHPEDQLVEVLRFGAPTGAVRCRACGAVLNIGGASDREVSGL